MAIVHVTIDAGSLKVTKECQELEGVRYLESY